MLFPFLNSFKRKCWDYLFVCLLFLKKKKDSNEKSRCHVVRVMFHLELNEKRSSYKFILSWIFFLFVCSLVILYTINTFIVHALNVGAIFVPFEINVGIGDLRHFICEVHTFNVECTIFQYRVEIQIKKQFWNGAKHGFLLKR